MADFVCSLIPDSCCKQRLHIRSKLYTALHSSIRGKEFTAVSSDFLHLIMLGADNTDIPMHPVPTVIRGSILQHQSSSGNTFLLHTTQTLFGRFLVRGLKTLAVKSISVKPL